MIRTSDYIELMTKTVGQGEKILNVFIEAPYVKLDFEYLKMIHKETGAKIVCAHLRMSELMVVETDRGVILLDERQGFLNIVSHPAVDKYKLRIS